MMYGQKKSEMALYAVLWTILFAAAAISVYWDGLNPTPQETLVDVSHQGSAYDWMQLLDTWKFLAMFCIFFFVHNFLIAPLLVYRNWRWRYGVCAVLLMLSFTWFVTRRSPDAPKPRTGRTEFPKHGGMRGVKGDVPPPGTRLSDSRRRIGMPPHPKDDVGRMGTPPDVLKAKPFGGPTAVAFNIMLLLLALNVGTKYYFKSLDDRKRMRDLERDNLNRQLQYLKYQINPHFFMNTLNNIHALVDIDPEEAKKTIEVLSKLMRYVLYDADKPMASLQKELDFLRHYVDLMRIRYTDKVRITLRLPHSLPDVQVPSLLLATFVENAFKHGVSYQKDSFIDVAVSVNVQERKLDFACNNSRKPEAEAKVGGVGLQNAVERLRLVYGNDYELKIDADAAEYRLLLRLPFKKYCL